MTHSATPRGGGLLPSNQDSNAEYESIDVLDDEELRRDGAIDSVDVVVSDHRSISSRPGAMRLIPVAVRRLLASNSGTSNDNRSDTTTATTETYESHATPTNVVTDVDGLLPLDLDKESSVHRKLYKDRLKDATNVIQRTNLTPADMSAHVAALQQKALRRLVQAGLGVILLDNDTYISDKDAKHGQTDNICILVDPYKNKGLLNLEFMREKDELAINQGNATGRLGEAQLRLHFGERVAFLFAFMHIYTKALLPLLLTLLTYYLALRFGPKTWDTYLIGLAILGFLITSVWAPMLLHVWNRETLLLVEKWNLNGYKQTAFEANDENPHFEYTWEQNVLTHQYEKVPKTRKLGAMRATMGFFVLLSCVLQCICILPFIQVRIVLGLMIDVVFFEFFRWLSIKFVHWENCAKKTQFEAKFCDWLDIKLKWVWDPTLLSLDQLFVTPLVATQFLNMILETWVPYLMKKYRGKPFSIRYWFNTWTCTLRREITTHAKRAATNKSARKLSKDVSSSTRFFVPVLERSDDDNQHTAYHGIAYYINECNFYFSNADMVPLFTVKTSAAVNPALCAAQLNGDRGQIMMNQVVAFIVLEHLGFVIRYLVTQGNKVPSSIGNPSYLRLKQLRELTAKRAALVEQFEYMKQLRLIFDKFDRAGIDHLYEDELAGFLAEWVGTDRSKLNASILFRYMDKTRLGKVPFSTCCLMLRHAEYDRFFSVLLGTCDSLDNFRNDGMRLSITDDGLGAHARHLSRYQSLSDATPRARGASGDYEDSDNDSLLQTPPQSSVRQRMSSSSSSSSSSSMSMYVDPTRTAVYSNE
ncbi:hypothetical protein DYB25_004069 [Aphanomyces astaci]|uniref:Anoctamin transmembrane domain-containing protein n=4 Tax=Aphanomyces astaci TaxID=112090 RepID=A0A397AHS0_APHAT|nr:hypothetical protein DYB25_004069 [Aphanomyces astaci]RHY82108.1 hypothetical protein DYB31_001926 [Aphanomyces astaci]